MNKQDIETQIKLLFNLWVQEKEKEEAANDKIRYTGPVFGQSEYAGIMDGIFSNWWSGGKYTVQAETKFSQISERNHTLLCNAGSSANLLLMSAAKELYFQDGDKIATLSCGFPTTVNPIIQNRLTPVFLDIDLSDLNLNPQVLEDALKKDKKIKALFVAHTLGFKTKINEILDVARKYNIEVFFDNCDSYGTKYNGRPIQAYGKAVSYSFYVAHHLSSLDYTENVLLMDLENNICQKQIGDFVENYDYRGWKCVSFDKEGKLNWENITGVVAHEIQEELYDIKLQTGRKCKITGSHSVFTLKNNEIVEVKASELLIGDYILAPNKLPNVEDLDYVKMKCYHKGSWKEYIKIVDLDEEFAEFLGYFVAEGSLNHTNSGNYTISFSLHQKETHIVKKINNFIQKHFDVSGKSYNQKDSKGMQFVFSHKGLYNFLENYCGRGAKNKKIPNFIFRAKSNVKKKFIDAYYEGDGCEHRTYDKHIGFSMDCKTVSKQLSEDLFNLLLMLGINSRYSVPKFKINRNINGRDCNISQPYTVSYSNKSIMNAEGFRGKDLKNRQKKDLTLTKIIKINRCKSTSKYVYDLSVKGYENFIGGIGMALHNTGEGGGVSTNDDDFFTVARSMRSWGRYCASHKCCIRSENPSFFCPTAKLTKNCDLPKDYNVNYQFEYLGYNLKMLDLQASMLLAQIDRLEEFNDIRRANYAIYKAYFDSLKKFQFTTWNIDNETSPFSFPFLIPADAPFTRKHLIDHLTRNKIESRVLFGGNLMKHPAFVNKSQYWESFGGEHVNANTIMNRFLMVGVSPVLDVKKVDRVITVIDEFLSKW